jgi:thioredoxin-related protein
MELSLTFCSHPGELIKIKMKKTSLLLAVLISISAYSQDLTKFKLYSPAENAKIAIDKAVSKAKAEGKNVFIQIGGNWCIWCARFNDFVTKDQQIDSIITSAYVVYHMNYSKENYNAAMLAKYGYPQRFGFPVFLVLDKDGTLLHTQNSAYLEEGKSYSKEKVLGFFSDWSPAAFDAKRYTEQ